MDEVRLWGVLVILLTLAIVFIGAVGLVFFTKDTKRLAFAFDTVKVLLGFLSA